jgi:hypothetical protein
VNEMIFGIVGVMEVDVVAEELTSPNKVLRNGDKRRSRPQGLALLEACRRLRMPRRWGCRHPGGSLLSCTQPGKLDSEQPD